ncbi:MAG: cytochrome ubiquinol oxidase subunit I [Desulfovibrionaceae bacterium CG1_02_65_16]|nr:MAG: cytochrome ubiquinol oxidase subunit I [Desulfovibrionaceae bacterium CG1_02_65_16]
MDVLMLSRLQFAAATVFHFLFVPLTLGLSVLIACMETAYARTDNPVYKRMAKFWGKLFLINFTLGVVTGITLEFQFGTNWSRYSAYMGDIFGSLLAIEATAAFFLESTMIGVWHFGWEKLSPKAHATIAWLVALASNLSAVWILIANGFMQNPLGFVIRNGRVELADFIAVITNPWAWNEFVHVVAGAFCVATFFIAGISAWHLLRKQHEEFFGKSMRLAVTVGLLASIVVAVQGHLHGNLVAKLQPAKLAAMESHWETTKNAPMYLLQIPDEKGEKNLVQAMPVPGLLSFLAFSDFNAEVKGLKDFAPADRPPVGLTFIAFRVMVGIGTLMPLLMLIGYLKRGKLAAMPTYLKIMIWAMPLPYLGMEAGWTVAEVGRQPWIINGLMRTADAVSPITVGQAGSSLVAMVLLYTLLGAAGAYLMLAAARKGPQDA